MRHWSCGVLLEVYSFYGFWTWSYLLKEWNFQIWIIDWMSRKYEFEANLFSHPQYHFQRRWIRNSNRDSHHPLQSPYSVALSSWNSNIFKPFRSLRSCTQAAISVHFAWKRNWRGGLLLIRSISVFPELKDFQVLWGLDHSNCYGRQRKDVCCCKWGGADDQGILNRGWEPCLLVYPRKEAFVYWLPLFWR